MINTAGMEKNENFGMTVAETNRLAELEVVIAENFQGFYAVGCALAEIKASKLYRMKHVTFEDYCKARFEIARRTAYQYIEAKEVMDNVRRGAQTKLLPLNERQARPLTKLEPEEQIQAWAEVVKSAPFDGGITAKHVSEVVAGLIGKELTKKAEKIKKDIEPTVTQEFNDALWALINVVRNEMRGPLKAKRRKIMIESLQRVEKLLSE